MPTEEQMEILNGTLGRYVANDLSPLDADWVIERHGMPPTGSTRARDEWLHLLCADVPERFLSDRGRLLRSRLPNLWYYPILGQAILDSGDLVYLSPRTDEKPEPPEPPKSEREQFVQAYEVEFDKFLDGVYQEIPPKMYVEMFKRGFIPDIEWFLHISIVNDDKVGYTADRKDLIRGRQLATRFGRFMTRMFNEDNKHTPYLSSLYAKEINRIIFGIATTPEEIKDVYMHGPHSCMAHSPSSFYTNGHHPCEVYAGSGDTGVAWMKKPGSDRYSARAVVNLKTKEWIRIYGDERVFADVLTANGFSYNPSALIGCRLDTIEIREGVYVGPYLDGDCCTARIENGWIVVDEDGTMVFSNQNGQVVNGTWCDSCEEYVHADTHFFTTVHGMSVCESCIDQFYTRALDYYGDSAYGSEEDFIYVECDDEWVTNDRFESLYCWDYNDIAIHQSDARSCYFTGQFVHHEEALSLTLPSGINVFCLPGYDDSDDIVLSQDGGFILADAAIYDEATDSYSYEGQS